MKKEKSQKNKITKYTAGHLDGYINGFYRSLKCFRDQNFVGARLEASRSVHFFLNTIFGVEGRTTPYYKYLEWELEKYPLKFPIKPKDLIKMLLRILEDADIQTQQKLFNVVEKVFRNAGYSNIFDAWDAGSIKLIKSFKK